MRILARIVFGLVLVAGVLLAIVYPNAMRNTEGQEIGRWRVYDADGGGFREAEPALSPTDAPAAMTVELRSMGPLRSNTEREMLVLTVLDAAGSEALRTTLRFPGGGLLESPQTGVILYREAAGALETADGGPRFLIEAGRDFEDRILTADLILNAASYRIDPRIRPVGFGLMALGAVGFGLSLLRRRENPNSQPPPKWGRR